MQSVACLTQEPEVPGGYMARPHTSISSSADSRKKVVSYWQKYVHLILVRGLSLPRKSLVRLTDRPNRTIDVYYGRKTAIKQRQHQDVLACV